MYGHFVINSFIFGLVLFLLNELVGFITGSNMFVLAWMMATS